MSENFDPVIKTIVVDTEKGCCAYYYHLSGKVRTLKFEEPEPKVINAGVFKPS
jgi:hypothetical protein